MKPTKKLHELGQSLWLDNITRDLLTTGTLAHYIDELSVTGLTSNPTIFDHAIKNSSAYDGAIREKRKSLKSGEDLFFDLAIEDITQAADLFRAISEKTNGVDGWVSLEVSPLLAHDTASTLAAARDLHARAGRPNLFIKIPGTSEGLPAIEEAILAGVPINVTRSCFPASTMSQRRNSSVASSGASTPGSTPMSAPWPRCSSADGTPRSWTGCRRCCTTALGSPWPGGSTRRTATSSTRHAGSERSKQRQLRPGNGSCGPAQEPKTPRPPTSSTSRPSPRRSP